jgi:hypothetical protein
MTCNDLSKWDNPSLSCNVLSNIKTNVICEFFVGL